MPHIPRAGWIALILLLGVMIVNTIRTRPFHWQSVFLDRASFGIWILLFFQYFLKAEQGLQKIGFVLSLSSFGVALYGIVQILTLIPSDNVPYFEIASTFGHSNITAQFLGCALVFQWFALRESKNLSRWMICFIDASIVLSTSYIYFLLCRSVWLATGLAFGVAVYRQRLMTYKRALILFLCAISFTLCVGFLRQNPTQTQSGAHQVEKGSNAAYRLEVWRATLLMIRDFPFGVGPDRFQYTFPPYKAKTVVEPEEGMADRSPHNEFLRFLVEEGVVVVALLFFLLLGFGRKFFRSRNDLSEPERQFVWAFFVFLGIEMSFQFPMQNALPSLMVAAVGGFLLSRFVTAQMKGSLSNQTLQMVCTPSIERISFIRGVTNLWFFVFYSVYAWTAVGEFYAAYAEALSPENPKRMEWACKLAPSFGRVCLRHALLEYQQGRKDEAQRLLLDRLKYFPYEMVTINYLFQMQMDQKDLKNACYWMNIYDSIYNQKSGVHSYMEQNCK